jgi:AcrR family transcriptional regulator
MSSRTAAKKDLKRSRILEIAKRRFGRFGIRATTMQDIAQEVGVAVGTIYQFFPDKDALVLAWVEDFRRQLRQQWEEVLGRPIAAEQKLREFITLRFHTERKMREEPAIHEVSRAVMRLVPEAVGETVETIMQYLGTILAEGRRTGSLPSVNPRPDAEVLFHALGGFFPTTEDPIMGPPQEKTLLLVIDWFIAKWKLPRPKSRS